MVSCRPVACQLLRSYHRQRGRRGGQDPPVCQRHCSLRRDHARHQPRVDELSPRFLCVLRVNRVRLPPHRHLRVPAQASQQHAPQQPYQLPDLLLHRLRDRIPRVLHAFRTYLPRSHRRHLLHEWSGLRRSPLTPWLSSDVRRLACLVCLAVWRDGARPYTSSCGMRPHRYLRARAVRAACAEDSGHRRVGPIIPRPLLPRLHPSKHRRGCIRVPRVGPRPCHPKGRLPTTGHVEGHRQPLPTNLCACQPIRHPSPPPGCRARVPGAAVT
mmetsp:Transcript_44808/g.89494  ORF Transcript_44808/g.89494 Transcript_44808/m.89494 type:complete len:270 (-) Transcript_44808:339-1148(-)